MTDRDQRAADPFRLNLEQQKKRAKDLLKALKSGDPDAMERIRANHPDARRDGSRPDGLDRLSDAQLVIARELGLPSWPALKSHIAAMERNRSDMQSGRTLDTDMDTLHIRCGMDVKQALSDAGFSGDFLEYSDPFCQGPVVAADDFLDRRAGFLADAYGAEMGLTKARCLARLESEEAALASAAARYERVVLWFEHDSYDQLILARCLVQFAEFGAASTLELIDIDRFPGSIRFIGLGQLPPEALRLLWSKRRAISREQLDLGARVWRHLRAPEPVSLYGAVEAAARGPGAAALPHMRGAVLRHLQELPSVRSGAGFTEAMVLEILSGGQMPIGMVYRDLMVEKEPQPWLGDLMFLHIVETMLAAADPAIAVDPDGADAHWPQRRIALTGAGRAVLAGERDYMSLGPPERWVGGVRIAAGSDNWRWDFEGGRPVRMPAQV
ncbi:DUF1835 domain-containing protein [Microbaculum marinum]|uniref:DUF1835 domain-containing protein n=1 Tax=Microbaculum marinum TaxID=1764581 RepID=A0AAW9RN91_9HYPH